MSGERPLATTKHVLLERRALFWCCRRCAPLLDLVRLVGQLTIRTSHTIMRHINITK